MSRSLIEQWFPAAAVGAESLRERGSPKAYPPINFLHVWWARRPLTASRAAVVATLLPAWPNDDEVSSDERAANIRAGLYASFPRGEEQYRAWFLRFLGILADPVAARASIKAAVATGRQTRGNAYGYPRAFTISPDSASVELFHDLVALRADLGGRATVLDPFAGGGSIPFEAARFGCDTISNELNPVAAAILEGTLALPASLGSTFSSVIKGWGTEWAKRVQTRLADVFTGEAGETNRAYIWAHTVPCPTTGLATPLAPNFWLARGGTREQVAVALEVDSAAGICSTTIVRGDQAKPYGDRATYRQGAGESVWTGETFSGEYIRRMGIESKLGQMLIAVSMSQTGAASRQFRAPTEEDRAAVARAERELSKLLPGWEVDDLVPTEPIFEGKETKRSVDMGMARWADMFAPRQLLTNLTALEELRLLLRDARVALPASEADALALYLAFAFDRVVNYNSRLSGWDSKDVGVSNTFDRHDFAFKWTFGEFDGANSLLPWTIENSVRNHVKVCALLATGDDLFSPARKTTVSITRGPAQTLALPDASVDAIVTDPPYYDNVMYAECSDYFYVWLKRILRDSWPKFTDLAVTDKTLEAVANPALFKDVAIPSRRGRGRADGKTATELANERYEQLLNASFREAHRVLKADGAMTVMFTHRRVDAWDTLGAALLDAGFSISTSWPVHTESDNSLHQAKKNSVRSTIFLACRKRPQSLPGYWADIRRDVEKAAERAAREFADQGLTGIDLTIATFGPVLSVLSDRWPVYSGELGADGRPEVLRPEVALDLAREKVNALKKRSLLGGREVDFDRITDWWLLAWSDFQAAEFPFDEARLLCISTHLEFDDVAKAHKLVKSSSGKVTLLSPAQRRTAGGLDPEATSHATWIDQLHALMLIYEEDGLNAAKSWLARTGLHDDQRFVDLVAAALHAVPRVQDRGQFARPEARTLDSLRAALFEQIPAPVDGTFVQEAVFEADGDFGIQPPGALGYDDE